MAQPSDFNVFDSESYARLTFPKPTSTGLPLNADLASLVLPHLVNFYKQVKSTSGLQENSLRVLDYGCGPSIPFTISAASMVTSEIVLADYTEQNREFVMKWLNKDPLAYDWTPYFEYIVEKLEGGSKQEAIQREEDYRRKVKTIVDCDINKEQFIAEGYGGMYDVVMTFVCLESACADQNAFKSAIKKLVSLINSGGHFIICCCRRENTDDGFYTVKEAKFFSLALKREFVVETLQANGLTITEETFAAIDHETFKCITNSEGYIIFTAKKN